MRIGTKTIENQAPSERAIAAIAAEAQVEPDVSYVYFLRNADGGSFKIGKSDKPFSRIKQLPEKIDLENSRVFTVSKKDVFRHERILQALFGEYNIDKEFGDGYTEWFDISQFDRAIRYVSENQDLIGWSGFDSLLGHFEKKSGQKFKILDNSFAFENGLQFEFVTSGGVLRAPTEEDVRKKAFKKIALLLQDLLLTPAFSEDLQPYFHTGLGPFWEPLFESEAFTKYTNHNDSIFFDVFPYKEKQSSNSKPQGLKDYEVKFSDTDEIERGCVEIIRLILLEEQRFGIFPLIACDFIENYDDLKKVSIYSPDAKALLDKLELPMTLKLREQQRPFIEDLCESLVEQLVSQWLPHLRPDKFIDKVEIVARMFEDVSKAIQSKPIDTTLVRFLEKNIAAIEELSKYMVAARCRSPIIKNYIEKARMLEIECLRSKQHHTRSHKSRQIELGDQMPPFSSEFDDEEEALEDEVDRPRMRA